jgi:hypothetical protein
MTWDMMTGSVTDMERAYERSWLVDHDRYFIGEVEDDTDTDTLEETD